MNVKGIRRNCAILEGIVMTSVWRKLGELQKISGYLVSCPKIQTGYLPDTNQMLLESINSVVC
jgi:hypothetical protein